MLSMSHHSHNAALAASKVAREFQEKEKKQSAKKAEPEKENKKPLLSPGGGLFALLSPNSPLSPKPKPVVKLTNKQILEKEEKEL